MPDNDPGVLARGLREADEALRALSGDMMYYGPSDQRLLKAAAYLESLFAPVEDEERVCREILARAYGKIGRKFGAVEGRDEAALAAMREYARRLRAPVRQDVVIDDQRLCEIVHDATAGPMYPRGYHSGETMAVARAVREAVVKEYDRAPVGVTVGEPALTGLEVTDEMIEAALMARVPGGSEVWCWLPQKDAFTPHETARDVMRCALTAALQAEGGSPPSPKQTSELEEAGNGRGMR